jgi:hypothetical protein
MPQYLKLFLRKGQYDTFVSNANDTEYERIINGDPGYVIWGTVFVILTVIGNIGNIITIIILKRDPIISTLTILLIGLAISDILAPQANAILAFTHYHLSHRYSNSVLFLKFNNFVRFIIQPLGSMFTMSSSWIITLTTLFRLIAVMCPFKARTLINKRLAIFSLVGIFLFSLISIIPIYTLLVTKERCTPDRKHVYSGFDLNIRSKLLESYIPVLQVLCFYLPWLTSLLLWFFLIRSLRNAERTFAVCVQKKDSLCSIGASNSLYSKRNSSLLSKFPNKQRFSGSISSTVMDKKSIPLIGLNDDTRNFNAQNRNRSYNRITLMIVVLCFINLICQLFTFVFIFELIYDKIVYKDYQAYMQKIEETGVTTEPEREFLSARMKYPKFLSYSLLLNNIFLGINHSSNLFIYLITNSTFRHNFIYLIKRFKYFLCKKFLLKLNGKNSVADRMKREKQQQSNSFNSSINTLNQSLKNHQKLEIKVNKKIISIIEAEDENY